MLKRTGLLWSLAVWSVLSVGGCGPSTLPAPPPPSSTPLDPNSPPPGVSAKITFETGRIPPVSTLSFDTRGDLLASGGDIVRIWDVSTGHLVRELPANGPNPAVAFSPDGKNIAVGGFFVQNGGSEELPMGQVIVFDTLTYRAHHTLIVQGGSVSCLAWSPDGSRLAASRQRGSVTQWDVATGKTLWKRDLGWSAPTDNITYSPDGKVIGVSSRDGTLKLVNADTGAWIYQLKDTSKVRASTFTPDGKTAISVGDSGQIKFWQVGNGKLLKTVDAGYKMNGVAMTSDGNVLATIGDPSQSGGTSLTLWDAHAMTRIKDLSGPSIGSFVTFSPNDGMLAYGGTQFPNVGGINLMDMKTHADSLVIAGQQDGPHPAQIAFSPDGKSVLETVNGSEAGTYVWDVAGAKFSSLLPVTPAAGDSFRSVAYGDKAAAVSMGSAFVNWAVPPGGAGTRQTLDSTSASAVALLADGGYGVVDVTQGPALELRDKSGKVTHTFPLGVQANANVPVAVVAQDGKWAAVASNNLKKLPDPEPIRVSLLDLSSGQAGPVLDYSNGKVNDDNPLGCLAISNDGSMVAVGSAGEPSQIFKRHGYVDVWKVGESSPVFSIDARAGDITSVAFSPDNKQVASCGRGDGRIRLWDVAGAKQATDILTHEDAVALAYSADGKYLAAGCADGSWRLYATRDRSLRATFMLLPPAADGAAPEWARAAPGYYEASAGADKYLFWRRGLELTPASTFSNVFHRPDLLVQSIHP